MSVNASRSLGTQPLGSQALPSGPSKQAGAVSGAEEPAVPQGQVDAYKGSGQLDGVRPPEVTGQKLDLNLARVFRGKIQELKNMSPAERANLATGAGLVAAGGLAKLTGSERLSEMVEGVEASKDGLDKLQKLSNVRADFKGQLVAWREAKANGRPLEMRRFEPRPLDRMAKLGAAVDVAKGAMAAVSISKTLTGVAKDPHLLKDPAVVKSLGRDAMGVLNAAGGVARLAGKSGLAAKLNPVTGIASGAFGVAGAATDIAKRGLNWKNGTELASQALNLAGNVAMVVPGGQVVGAGLKMASLGVDLIRHGVANREKIAAGARATLRMGADAARTAARFFREPGKTSREVAQAAARNVDQAADRVRDAVGDGARQVGKAFGGVKKFLGWGS
ncbi:MAG: hypothetical protein VKO21_08345 [Candidatus Sericytochromatia bacterium]|nr:hypothetical protein [Candidatus Sericytochromatia bacterium]